MGQLSISLLGEFQAVLNGRPLTAFRTNKVQALLIYLAAEPQSAFRREMLMTLLWPGMPESSARANLRQILFHLRRAVSDSDDDKSKIPFIAASRHEIRLNPEARIKIDTVQFDEELNQVNTHEHVDPLACRACYERYVSAISLYRGDFLADFYLDDSNQFEEWAERTRQQFRRKMLDALDALTRFAMRRSDYAEARSYVERQIVIDNLSESAHRQLMEIQARSGQRAAALALYESYRTLLAEELGMAPSAMTDALYEQVKAGDLSFDQPQTPDVRGYELQGAIGGGSYGVIYRAVQLTVGRAVAVKIIRRRYAKESDFIRRFEAEAQIIARLEHPHIVPLYDYWRDPEGAYLVMRFMRGGNLRSSLAHGPWKADKTLAMLDQLAGALSSAHRQGVVHRDIKPANILFDEPGNAYLSDFGIARDLTGQVGQPALVEAPDSIPREPIIGQRVGPGTDIYSLGVLLYETLTGEKPFPDHQASISADQHSLYPLPPIGNQQPTVPHQVDNVLQRATASRPADRYSDALELAEDFRRAVHGQSATGAVPVGRQVVRGNPYKGLRTFTEADASDFFGRDSVVARLISRLGEIHFLAIVGPSGSGKSSIVKAGLVPALRGGALPGSDKWFMAEMVPGVHPLEALENALWPLAVDPPPSLVEPMAHDARGLLRTVRRVLPGEDQATLLLIVDQFEELFTLVDDRGRQHFFALLLSALAEPDTPLRLVITLRADFYDRPLEHHELGGWLQGNTEVILPLSAGELTAAISEPARRAGVSMEGGLVPAIVSDVQDQPGGLPLLQYALTELFDRRQTDQMTLAAYEEIGGVSGALARRAEDVYKGLNLPGQQMTRQLFLRLVTLGEAGEVTPRRVARVELEGLATAATVLKLPGQDQNALVALANVLDLFGRYRLLTFDRDRLTRAPTVQVAHEALLRSWPRLRGWLEDGRDDIRLQRLLGSAAAEWRGSGQDNGYLLRGSRLRRFESWAEENRVALTRKERDYLDESVSARHEREAQVAAQRAKEERLESVSRSRLHYLLGILAVATVVAVSLSLLALTFGRRAQQEARVATSRELAAAAVNNLGVDPELSVLLALEGLKSAYTVEAENALHRSVPEMHLLQTLTGHSQIVESLAISPDGTRYASAAGPTVILWDAGRGEEILRFDGGSDIIFAMRFSPDGRQLITASRDQTARIWNSATGEELLRIDHGAPLGDLSISPNGSRIITGGADGVARVWAVETGKQLLALAGHARADRQGSLHPGGVVSVAFTPDGQRIATGGADGTVRLWDANDGRMLWVLSEHSNEVYVAPDPGGNRLLTAGFDGQVKIWSISTAQGPPEIEMALIHDQPARDAVFSPDGTLLAVAGQDGAASVWDAHSGKRLLSLVGHGGLVDDLEFTPDSARLVTVAEDQTLKVWDMSPGRERLTIIDGRPIDVAYSPDGAMLATAHSDGSIALRSSVTGTIRLTLSGHPGTVGAVFLDYSSDGERLASASWDSTAKLWDPATGQGLLTLAGHSGYVWQAAFSPDGSRVVTASEDGSARVWDTASGQELLTLSDDQRQVLGVAYSPDGSRIVSIGCSPNMARIWHAASGQPQMILDAGDCLWGVAFSPDGRQLATGRTDGTVVIWDITGAEGRIVSTMTGHTAFIPRLAFSPDGEKLATASFDGSAKVWDVATGQEWLTFPADESVTRVVFSPDGSELATASRDGQVRIWLLDLQDLVTLAKSRLTRGLTDEECQKFLHQALCLEAP